MKNYQTTKKRLGDMLADAVLKQETDLKADAGYSSKNQDTIMICFLGAMALETLNRLPDKEGALVRHGIKCLGKYSQDYSGCHGCNVDKYCKELGAANAKAT